MDPFELGQQIGNLDARCARVEQWVAGMSEKLDGIALSLAEKKGERKVFIYLATLAGGVGSLLVTIVVKLWGHS